MVYNRAYGVLACVAGRFPLKGNYTTKLKKPLISDQGLFCIAPSAGHSLQATLSKRSQQWRLPRTFPFSNCFRSA